MRTAKGSASVNDLRLFFLGPPRIETDGVALSFDTRKAVALLAYLAVEGSSITRDAAAALLFPDYEPERAYANVRRTLWALNKAGLGAQLDISGEMVGLRRDPGVWVDVDEFRRLTNPAGSPAIPDLAAAAALYRDDFLAGFSLKDSPAFDDWQFFQAESLRGELAGVLERLSTALTATAAYAPAIAHARRWLVLDPRARSPLADAALCPVRAACSRPPPVPGVRRYPEKGARRRSRNRDTGPLVRNPAGAARPARTHPVAFPRAAGATG
jgi:DNA-binding SARP family transcriptional activator